ncbi:MAG TPA: ROK family protein [Thermodesulfovibrionales bacterium]|nr:ROK family protein [Thermodesulfovibrionales bacterium]
MKKHYAIGIDLGGTNLRVALVSEDGEIINKRKLPSIEQVEESLLRSAEEVFTDGVVGIGLGVAGLIDRERFRVAVSPNLPAVEGVDFNALFQDRFRVPVFIENDANVAALGEKWAGAGRDFKSFVLLTLGTGIGSGIIYDGRLMNVAAEVGHMSIIANGVKCSCGGIGCLESYAAAKAILGYAVTALEHGSESMLRELHNGNIYKLTGEDIYKAALEGDNLSRDVLKEAGRYLGVGISNIINIFSPEAIILSGGLIGAWNIYVQEAIKEASRRTLKHLFDRVKIIPSSLGDNAGIVGSACLALAATHER